MVTNNIFKSITNIYGIGIGAYSNYYMYLELQKSKRNDPKFNTNKTRII